MPVHPEYDDNMVTDHQCIAVLSAFQAARGPSATTLTTEIVTTQREEILPSEAVELTNPEGHHGGR